MEPGEAEPLAFGDIDRGVQVDQVARRTMRLVTGEASAPVRPFRPLAGKVLQQEFRQRLPVVREDAGGRIRPYGIQEFRQVIFQPVSAPADKLVEQAGCPVGSVHLIRVVEKGMRIGNLVFPESLFEGCEILLDGVSGKMIHNITFPAGSRPFHLLECFPAK